MTDQITVRPLKFKEKNFADKIAQIARYILMVFIFLFLGIPFIIACIKYASHIK